MPPSIATQPAPMAIAATQPYLGLMPRMPKLESESVSVLLNEDELVLLEGEAPMREDEEDEEPDSGVNDASPSVGEVVRVTDSVSVSVALPVSESVPASESTLDAPVADAPDALSEAELRMDDAEFMSTSGSYPCCIATLEMAFCTAGAERISGGMRPARAAEEMAAVSPAAQSPAPAAPGTVVAAGSARIEPVAVAPSAARVDVSAPGMMGSVLASTPAWRRIILL